MWQRLASAELVPPSDAGRRVMRRISLGIAALIVVSALQLGGGQSAEAKSFGSIVDSALNAVTGNQYGGYYGYGYNPNYGYNLGYSNPYFGNTSYVNPYVNPYANTYVNPYVNPYAGYNQGYFNQGYYDPYRRSTLGTVINVIDRFF
jgi:hypothetical protein